MENTVNNTLTNEFEEDNDRMISGQKKEEDTKEGNLRPQKLMDFIGQDQLKKNLSVYIGAAKQRNENLEHLLFYGPPGLGKTTLASIVSQEMNVNIKITSGPAIERPGDLAAILTNLQEGDILFIDEIHRLNRSVEEVLYPAMEDFELDIVIGEGPAARSIKLNLPPFTLVGATTRAGLLTSPLRDRFGITQRLEFYSPDDLAQVVERSARILKVSCDDRGVSAVAIRARGTPRIANRLLRRVRDYAEVRSDGHITGQVAEDALDILEVDEFGLDVLDRSFLLAIMEKFSGGPVGIESLAAAIGEERGTLEDVVEPFLIQSGFLTRTSRGRMATPRAFSHFGLSMPVDFNGQGQMFNQTV